MVISVRVKNFFSIRDEAVIDFTADAISRKSANHLEENLIDYDGDKFVNIIGMFGSNAAGKSNIIKAIEFCRALILSSHKSNEGDEFDYKPFRFGADKPSEFGIKFVTAGTEYEYSFSLFDNKVIAEELYYYPNGRRAKVFTRESTKFYTFGKGAINRPTEVEANTGPRTLFLSRASSMNRPVAQAVYRFFLNEITFGSGIFDLSGLSREDFESNKAILLKAFEVSDSDIIDLRLSDSVTGSRLLSFHKENPLLAFDFEREESEGTKRLLMLLLLLIRKATLGATILMDEFDLKLHLRLAELILDVIRASKGAQLLFTSHNSTLIDTDKLRKEQIVFVNKQSNGNSEFVPLADIQGLSKTIDIQKAYLQGRFDAVPYVGDIYPVLSELIAKK